ncbi:MAG: Holliday junction branch migration protein RuvA [Bacteroidales bacterium]|jgi:Holliday junction DNA helicase RuvA|nr:Holliday junction branch migration protein RuvA [Bacteroidales bacterium]MDD3272617.1 Holliday junction branch migration protein RuvA [Bacteroidales bacterium]MDD4058169.1 Holliday junction branch migration protein RuvA [Bacteroidales bacterium]
MYDYIKGEVVEIGPTEVVVDTGSFGYKLQISLQTYSKLQAGTKTKLFIHHHLREDIELMYGFIDKEERTIFQHLIEVSGIGPNTARMMLSSMTSEEIRNAIITADINRLKSIKGIGLKTAQRLLIELKDKIVKGGGGAIITGGVTTQPDAKRDEAISALILLGFNKTNVEKVVDGILREEPASALEELIKLSLKRL